MSVRFVGLRADDEEHERGARFAGDPAGDSLDRVPLVLGIFLAGGFIGLQRRSDFGGFLIGCFGGLAVDGILAVLFFIAAGLWSARDLKGGSVPRDKNDRSAA